LKKNATFRWEAKEPNSTGTNDDNSDDFSLQNISFSAKKGKLTAIIGDTGSGKSSLLAALLGQMKLIQGDFKVQGSVSYVPQEAWLLNMSLRDNIVFGSEYDVKAYAKTIKVCALTRDIDLMSDGDRTEIGERGLISSQLYIKHKPSLSGRSFKVSI